MRELNKLSEEIAHILAAGEVVERPASCVKEVIENSIDAGASFIDIKLEKGGIKKIEVYDNGKGIHPEDIKYVFERHTTSKIKTVDDIFKIKTMGFRGEALCAISSVSKVTLISRHYQQDQGYMVKVEGGKVNSKTVYPFEKGTKIIIEDLFFNTPARLKFLKSPSVEQKYCAEVAEKIAICYPEISFRMQVDNKRQLFTPGDGKVESAVASVFGTDILKSLIDFHQEEPGLKVWGYFANPVLSKSTRSGYYFYVNRRFIRSKLLSSCIDEVFKNSILTGRFPIIFLFIEIDPSDIDVNVHPTKLEIKFKDERFVYNTVYKAISKVLQSEKIIPKPDLNNIYSHQDKQESESKKTSLPFIYEEHNFEKNSFENLSEFLKIEEQLDFSELEPKQCTENVINIFSKTFELETYKIVGYAFDTYIIVEKDESLYLIDQHAVHERRLFELFKEEVIQNKIQRQMLLSPVIVDLPPSQKEFVLENAQFFERLGFEVGDFGKNEIIVRTVPVLIKNLADRYLIFDIVEMLYNESISAGLVQISEELLKEIACKAAVKGNMNISDLEKEEIVKLVLVEKRIFHCPHGRPVVVEIPKKDIEKMFKRIV
ncbi:DNA mismatch repair endonuclease MutL [Caldicellulosiruptor morganii]|uniref:DNA mismatch repair protein MutL n=1 Tax=Caldicellulosiruptor morganii TaxID=1387555 RepID=A0ABY7BPP3_9FIRM|nr:DNA mismatch repair endonuclease MutL [Caldicellulosiruptor morganii]WAM34804.1 DNA mismatch repair endonuclease MutL [Caldicellulosiruptor morganii]